MTGPSSAPSPRVSTAVDPSLVRLVGTVVFLDTLFLAVVAPLLPSLAHELHLTKLSAGLLTASYPVGTLLGALPGGALAARIGPRRTVVIGLVLLAGASLAFGLLRSAVLIDLARFVQGLSGACTWAGGLAWLLASAPPEQRGAVIGRALGAAIFGSLLGPVVGVLAQGLGRGPVFAVVAASALALIVGARRHSGQAPVIRQGWPDLWAALRTVTVLKGCWLVAIPALCEGALSVLTPLRLHRYGAGAAEIGAVFLVASALGVALSPWIGAVSDRRGRRLPLLAGLALAAAALPVIAVPTTAVLIAVVTVAALLGVVVFWAPAIALLSDAAHERSLDQAFAVALVNLAWAVGQIAGAGGGGALGQAAGDGVPLAGAAALCAVTLLALLRGLWIGRRRGPS